MVLTAALPDALRQVVSRPFVSPPLAFDGTLDELFRHYIAPNLPAPSTVTAIHRTLVHYCSLEDPLLLLRYVRGETRGHLVRTPTGRYRPTDNSPAWLMHFLAFNDIVLPAAEQLEPLIAEWPCHMFDLARMRIRTVSHHGWHIAHLLPVKDRNTARATWSRAELVRRFIRNVHPCNYSYLPKPEWPRYGADATVIAFIAREYRERYGAVWREFVALAGDDAAAIGTGDLPTFRYCYSGRMGHERGVNNARTAGAHGPDTGASALDESSLSARLPRGLPAATYRAKRLMFRRNVIEPLADRDRFRVETPDGTFEFSKADFVRVFANVISSASYREGGIYHYATIPAKARPFRIDASDH